MNDIHVRPDCHKRRWLTYVDLLGFSKLVQTKDWIHVFAVYSKSIEEAKRKIHEEFNIQKMWFSDTFLFYAPDDSKQSFAAVESISRWFVYFSILARIPLRGAMACGDFYADEENKMHFGKALIEAYNFGEKQNWIGFIFAPSATLQCISYDLDPGTLLYYAYADIPHKPGVGIYDSKLPAYIIGGDSIVNGQNLCVEALIQMKDHETKESIKTKYQTTIDFIEANRRVFREP